MVIRLITNWKPNGNTTHYYYYKYFLIIIGCFNINEKGGELLKKCLENSKEQMGSDELANYSVACGTTSSLPCDFVFPNFGKKLLS